MAEGGVQAQGDRGTEHPAHEPIADIPEIGRPDLLDLITFHQLPEGGSNPPAARAEHRTPLRGRVEALVPEGRCEQEVLRSKLVGLQRRPGFPIGQERALARRHDLRQDRQIRLICAGQRDRRDRLDPSGAIAEDMEPKAIEGLAGGMVVSTRGRVTEAAALVGAGESTDRDRRAVDERHRVGVFLPDELVPEQVLEFPEVGGLAEEGRAMDAGDGREEVGIMLAKESIDGLILSVAGVLADHFHRQHLAVGEDWLQSALPQATTVEDRGNRRIDQVIRRYNEVIQVHGAPP